MLQPKQGEGEDVSNWQGLMPCSDVNKEPLEG
jgi:hypothetical protein